MYVSFDNGAKWQSFEIDLPRVVVTDIRLAHGDLVLSTQGRGFWVLDNLSALRQLPQGAAAEATRLYKPATAIRINATGDKGGDPSEGPEYILLGAQLDYYLPAGVTGPVTLSILDGEGNTLRSFSSDGPAERPVGAGGGQEGGRAGPAYPAKLSATPGMHRFIWDLRHTGEPAVRAPGAPRPAGTITNGPDDAAGQIHGGILGRVVQRTSAA